jgi:hypothetical protein
VCVECRWFNGHCTVAAHGGRQSNVCELGMLVLCGFNFIIVSPQSPVHRRCFQVGRLEPAHKSTPCLPFPPILLSVSNASQTALSRCHFCTLCSLAPPERLWCEVRLRSRQHCARQRHPPAVVRVLLAAPQTHTPVPCLWVHGELTSCYSPHRPTTTLRSTLWTLAPPRRALGPQIDVKGRIKKFRRLLGF